MGFALGANERPFPLRDDEAIGRWNRKEKLFGAAVRAGGVTGVGGDRRGCRPSAFDGLGVTCFRTQLYQLYQLLAYLALSRHAMCACIGERALLVTSMPAEAPPLVHDLEEAGEGLGVADVPRR